MKKKQFIYSGGREGIQVTVVFLAHVYPERQMSPDYFFIGDASCFIYIVAASSERRISCKKSARSLFGKGTNCIFVLWKGKVFPADSVAILRQILRLEKCLFTLKSTTFSGSHLRHYVWAIACCTKNLSTSIGAMFYQIMHFCSNKKMKIWYTFLMI